MQALEEYVTEGHKRLGEESLVVETTDGYVWIPDLDDFRCVAITTKGARCKNLVFDEGQVWTFDTGFVGRLDSSWKGRLLSQTCNVHDDARAKGYVPVEWAFISRESVWE